MAENNNQNKKKEQGPKRPFYMVTPDSETIEFVKANSDGTYDISTQVGLVNPADKNRYAVVRFVNGKQLPGVITLGKDDNAVSFTKAKPNANGEIRVGLALASYQDENSGISLVVPRSKISGGAQKATKSEKSSRIQIAVSYPDSERVHIVQINLFTESADAEEGRVEITAGQKFRVDDQEYIGRHVVDVPIDGLSILIQPLERNERFTFTALGCGDSVSEQLLGKK